MFRRNTQRYLRILRALDGIDRKVRVIMTKQEDLDNLVGRVDVAVAGIRQDIADIKAANPDVDLSALIARVEGLEGLDAENPAPPNP